MQSELYSRLLTTPQALRGGAAPSLDAPGAGVGVGSRAPASPPAARLPRRSQEDVRQEADSRPCLVYSPVAADGAGTQGEREAETRQVGSHQQHGNLVC